VISSVVLAYTPAATAPRTTVRPIAGSRKMGVLLPFGKMMAKDDENAMSPEEGWNVDNLMELMDDASGATATAETATAATSIPETSIVKYAGAAVAIIAILLVARGGL